MPGPFFFFFFFELSNKWRNTKTRLKKLWYNLNVTVSQLMLSRRNMLVIVPIASFRDKSKICNLRSVVDGLTHHPDPPSSRNSFSSCWKHLQLPHSRPSLFWTGPYPVIEWSSGIKAQLDNWEITLMGCVLSRTPLGGEWGFVELASQFYFFLCPLLLLHSSFHKYL